MAERGARRGKAPASLILSGDLLSNNSAGAGGGVANAGGTLTVVGSEISDNNGGGFGSGGIQNGGPQNLPGTVIVESSVIFDNVCDIGAYELHYKR